jgi:hypothetical protein
MADPRDDLASSDDGDEAKEEVPSAKEGDPIVVSTDSDIGMTEGDDETLDPRKAYEVLEIRTPVEELETYGKARIETLARLGETEKSQLTASALDLARRALARVTGLPLPGARP